MHTLTHPEKAAEASAERIQRRERTSDGELALTNGDHNLRQSTGKVSEFDPDSPRASLGRCKTPGDAVMAGTQNLPDDQRAAIRWLYSYQVKHDLTCGEIGKLVGNKDGVTMSLLLRGKYTARPDNLVSLIKQLRERVEKAEQGHLPQLDFIPTALTERIMNLCQASLNNHRIGLLFGESQIGKTENLQYCARTIPNAFYVSIPTQGTLIHFTAVMGDLLHISGRGPEVRRRIINAVDSKTLLIFDEMHRCIPRSSTSSMALQTIEFIREIYDAKKPGIVMSGTEVFRDAFQSRAWGQLLKQTMRRRIAVLPLDDKPTPKDLNDFAEAFGLLPAHGEARTLQDKVIADEKLGVWLAILRMGRDLAAARQQKTMSWGDVISAEAALRKLEGRK